MFNMIIAEIRSWISLKDIDNVYTLTLFRASRFFTAVKVDMCRQQLGKR